MDMQRICVLFLFLVLSSTEVIADVKAEKWVERNSWFHTNKIMTDFALNLHAELVKKGVDPTSDEYYKKIDDGVKAKFPEYFSNSASKLDELIAAKNKLEEEIAKLKNIPPNKKPIEAPKAVRNDSCFSSMIQSPTPFMGNSGEIFKLSDGTIGEVGAEYEYLYEYYPSVTVCPTRSILILNGKSLDITIISTTSTSQDTSNGPASTGMPSVIESKIDDDFEGYESGNIYKLRNGQIWEQTSSRYRYRYKYAPDVIIFMRNGSYQMQVEGMDDPVTVERIH
jgi:hypothetical protein